MIEGILCGVCGTLEEQIDKAALFDWLAAREHVWQDRRLTVFNAAGQDLIYHAPTLAEAVEKAMEAEGGAR